MTAFDWLMWIGVGVLVALPPRLDPAIRLKEWSLARRRRR